MNFFFVLSTLHYQFDMNNQTYLQWATKEWTWFESSGMINANHLINDGIDGNCRNNGQTTWTYNQGVVLGGLVNLYTITKNDTLLNIAQSIADAVYGSSLVYSNGGVLREPCETNSDCGPDGPQFKGILLDIWVCLHNNSRVPKEQNILHGCKQMQILSGIKTEVWKTRVGSSGLGLLIKL